MKNNQGFAPMFLLLSIVVVLAVGGGAYYLGTKSSEVAETTEENNLLETNQTTFKKIVESSYSFEVPEGWTHTGPRDLMGNGCLWDSLSKGGDGLRMGGEIGIYPKSCFDLSKSTGKKEFTEKDGYYIIAYYDKESGTTAEEEQETKLAYKKIISTFSLISNKENYKEELPDVRLMTEDQISKEQLSWKNSVVINGKVYPFPNGWVADTIIVNGIKINITYPAPKQIYTPNNYIALSFPASLVNSLKTTKCIGDSEVSSCMIGSDSKIGRYFDVMWYFH